MATIMLYYGNIINYFIENAIKLDDVCNVLFLTRKNLLNKLYLNNDDFSLLEIKTLLLEYNISPMNYDKLFIPIEYAK